MKKCDMQDDEEELHIGKEAHDHVRMAQPLAIGFSRQPWLRVQTRIGRFVGYWSLDYRTVCKGLDKANICHHSFPYLSSDSHSLWKRSSRRAS